MTCCLLSLYTWEPNLPFNFCICRFGLSNKFDTEFPSVLTGKVMMPTLLCFNHPIQNSGLPPAWTLLLLLSVSVPHNNRAQNDNRLSGCTAENTGELKVTRTTLMCNARIARALSSSLLFFGDVWFIKHFLTVSATRQNLFETESGVFQYVKRSVSNVCWIYTCRFLSMSKPSKRASLASATVQGGYSSRWQNNEIKPAPCTRKDGFLGRTQKHKKVAGGRAGWGKCWAIKCISSIVT